MSSTAQFRIQHVAARPRGWRVRTKREGRHELRIAFPPGARRKGSGKVLEILHPKGERNPDCTLAGKNPAELIIFGNPARRGGPPRESKIFDTSTVQGLRQAERYKSKLENKYDKVTTTPVGLDQVKIEGIADNPRTFSGWKNFTKYERGLLRRMHFGAPKNESEVQAMKEMLRKIDEINAKHRERGTNPDSETGKLIRSFGLTRDPHAGSGTIYDTIRHGDRVTIVNRFGQQSTGRAVMLGPAGWVLNMGGAHGTPAIASPENVTRVKKSNSSANPAWMKVSGLIGKVIDSRGTLGSPEYLLETKDGRQVWVKPDYRPRVAKNAWTEAERKRFAKQEAKREEIINRLHGQKGYPPPADAAEASHFQYLLDATQKRMDRLAKKLTRNPEGADSGEEKKAVKLFQTFHGKDPRGIIEKHVSDAMRMEYAALGALEYLLVENENGDKVKIDFEGDGVTLASSPQANQLYFIGGNQNLSPCLGKFTDDASKDFIDLGDALEVQYLARKAQGNFDPVKYFHKFGEEKRGSDLPRAIYDKLRKQVFLAGGEYTIEQPGIIN